MFGVEYTCQQFSIFATDFGSGPIVTTNCIGIWWMSYIWFQQW